MLYYRLINHTHGHAAMYFIVDLHPVHLEARREVQIEYDIAGEKFGKSFDDLARIYSFDAKSLEAMKSAKIGKVKRVREVRGVRMSIMRVG